MEPKSGLSVDQGQTGFLLDSPSPISPLPPPSPLIIMQRRAWCPNKDSQIWDAKDSDQTGGNQKMTQKQQGCSKIRLSLKLLSPPFSRLRHTQNKRAAATQNDLNSRRERGPSPGPEKFSLYSSSAAPSSPWRLRPRTDGCGRRRRLRFHRAGTGVICLTINIMNAIKVLMSSYEILSLRRHKMKGTESAWNRQSTKKLNSVC